MSDAEPHAPGLRRTFLPRGGIVAIVAIAAAAAGALWINAGHARVSTDNAYVRADMSIIAPRVRGHVTELLVVENQRVAAGAALLRLDDEEYRARLAAAEADVARASAAVAETNAAIGRLGAEAELARASVAEAQSSIRAADAEKIRAAADRDRYAALARDGLAPRQRLDNVSTVAASADANADRSRAALAMSTAQTSVVARRRAEAQAQHAAALADEAKAKAALDLAQQDLDHTLVRAPISGDVGDLQARVGDYVQPGSRLMAIVPTRDLYVVANFKETQTGRMLAGQRAIVRIDALPGRKLAGVVESLAPGSGSEFALLPFEPGSGNFTKIVQRVPVRVRIATTSADLARLRPGLSATVTVDLGSRR